MDEKDVISETNHLLVGLVIGIFCGGIFVIMISGGLTNSEAQETDKNKLETVCVEKDIDFVEAYPEDSWERLDKIPESGLIKKDDFTNTDGGIWLTLNTSEADIEPPEKVVYKSVSECTEYTKVAN